MLLINCDLGERGVAHPLDDKLVDYIDIANIACGGHAGDKTSVNYYVNLCREKNVKITAHISYPDKENFGRKAIDIDHVTLCESFDEQFALFDNKIKAIKPHGALYNQLNVKQELAKTFIEWCIKNDVDELVVSPFGVVAEYAKEKGIKTINESFAERGYMLDNHNNPMLIPRGQANAEIDGVQLAVEQYNQLKQGFIKIAGVKINFESQTICIHSDSNIALELAQQLYKNKG
ncbi:MULTISPECIES: 5-oxoprolinase subunit PxpA [Francisella]|uniref:LamB/YcsF family protein n=1 Tax=Francisella opportunistica TaxID=2016517 RepID=A0A345JP88_9GAMM|nr:MULTISPECIES: 5-oxoprolinase subunit PxpA [Francisella]APC90793.1 Lactam utilization protein LamB [Francisella sp. MA067296]AXH29134.1 LamB/YcsF family protein [Francisella opportunistica]AXH30786.1 LamB/YcsF family protein [Francisella opportunistica]AXH32431.1 LamB/YcsF family protein [Francisella opportunistica]